LIVYHDARIDPGNAFRLVVKVGKYVAEDEYGRIGMAEQQHVLWFDRNSHYSMAQFTEDLAAKVIWGPSQTLAVWVLDQDTGSEWKIRREEHFQQMISDRWDQRLAIIAVDVVRKDACNANESSSAATGRCVSGVTSGPNGGPSAVVDDVEGCGDTCSSPEQTPTDLPLAVDWDSLTILVQVDDDGTAKEVVDEDKVYEAMRFKESEATHEVPITAMNAEMQADMGEAAVNVDDIVDEEPLHEWDRDNPDMSVGTLYPSMKEFRLAVRQHAIVNEFEYDIEHSDKQRYRANCSVLGCPWILRARTQHDGSVRVLFL
jgi:hypothetical protein